MITQPNDFLMQAWQRQVDGYLRTIEASASKLRELQLEAAAAPADAEKCAAYWRRFYEIGAQTQRDFAQCMVAAPAAAPAAHEDSKQAVLTVIDQAYKQWLDATQQLYNLPQAGGVRQEAKK